MPDHTLATIMLVEDDPGHARLIERNLRRAHAMTREIIQLADGQQAFEYLFHSRGAAHALYNTPLLIVLDLHLPGMDGYIPVIVFTTTDEPGDIERGYQRMP